MPEPPAVAATPAPEPVRAPNGRKIYSRDFLMRLCESNNAMPAGLQSGMDGLQALFDRSGGARDNDGGYGGHRGPGRQHSGRGGFDRADSRGGYGGGQEWNRLPRGNSQPPGGFCGRGCCCCVFVLFFIVFFIGVVFFFVHPRPRIHPPTRTGLPPGMPPMGGRGPPLARGGSRNDDRWGQRGPLPPPRHNPAGDTWGHSNFEPQPKLHKTTNSYKVGVISSDNPELEKKAKEIQSLLNKLTADNFDRILSVCVWRCGGVHTLLVCSFVLHFATLPCVYMIILDHIVHNQPP